MSVFLIILLILFGIFLFIVEFFLIPGVTIAGIGGAILVGVSIYFAYKTHGSTTGNLTLLGAFLVILVTLVVAFRSDTWKKLMLGSEVQGKVTYGLENGRIKVGDTGETVTRLNPVGRVMVNDILVEAKSMAGFVDQNKKVTVIKVLTTQIVVKPLESEET